MEGWMRSASWVLAVAIGLVMPLASRAAEDDEYLHRFAHSWKGGGTASLNLHLPSWRVACNLAASKGTNRVSLSGLCRLKLISFLSKQIDTTLNYNPGSDSYSGTYSVDGGPPAILSGRLSGDSLNLDVTWPILVNGHYKARIHILNDGHGHFTLTTIDPLGLYGEPMVTSNLRFAPE
jgi:hypothetical protein